MNTALKFNYIEIFREGTFFLAILSTESTQDQMLQYLLNREVARLFIHALEYRGQSTKLIMYIMQALDRFFDWDK